MCTIRCRLCNNYISDEPAIFSEYDMFSMNLTIDLSFQCPVLNYEEAWIKHVQNWTHIPRIWVRLWMLNYNSLSVHISYQLLHHLMLVINQKFSTRIFFFRMLFMLIFVIFRTHLRCIHTHLRNQNFELVCQPHRWKSLMYN